MLLHGDAGFPAGGALAAQVVVGQGEQAADLGGAVKLVRGGRAEGAKAGAGDGEMGAELAGDTEARIEDVLVDGWKRVLSWQKLIAVDRESPGRQTSAPHCYTLEWSRLRDFARPVHIK